MKTYQVYVGENGVLVAEDPKGRRPRSEDRGCPRCGCEEVIRVESHAPNGMRQRRTVCRCCHAPARGRRAKAC